MFTKYFFPQVQLSHLFLHVRKGQEVCMLARGAGRGKLFCCLDLQLLRFQDISKNSDQGPLKTTTSSISVSFNLCSLSGLFSHFSLSLTFSGLSLFL